MHVPVWLLFEENRKVHEQIIQSGCESDVFVRSSWVDMRPKCGSPEDSSRVFHLEIWSLGMQYLEDVPYMCMVRKFLNIFNRCVNMYQPDDTTFVRLLSTCSHAGLVDEGV
jgi:hypothetical protein